MGVRLCKNGVVSATNISHLAPIHDMKLKTLDDGSVWALIFYHYTHSGNVVFTSVDEVLNTQSLDKYSRLYLLNSDRFRSAVDNKFEFMLCYPLESDDYNRWKQSNNPCDEYEGDIEYDILISEDSSTMRGTVAGYEPISIAWTSGYSILFGGLARYNSDPETIKNSYLIGSIVSNDAWFFSIGCFRNWNDGIPGNGFSLEGSECVELWVRIDNTNAANKVSFFSDCITANDIIEI